MDVGEVEIGAVFPIVEDHIPQVSLSAGRIASDKYRGKSGSDHPFREELGGDIPALIHEPSPVIATQLRMAEPELANGIVACGIIDGFVIAMKLDDRVSCW